MYDGHSTFLDSKCRVKREMVCLRELQMVVASCATCAKTKYSAQKAQNIATTSAKKYNQ